MVPFHVPLADLRCSLIWSVSPKVVHTRRSRWCKHLECGSDSGVAPASSKPMLSLPVNNNKKKGFWKFKKNGGRVSLFEASCQVSFCLPFRFHRCSLLTRKRAIRAVLVALSLCVINYDIKENSQWRFWIFTQKNGQKRHEAIKVLQDFRVKTTKRKTKLKTWQGMKKLHMHHPLKHFGSTNLTDLQTCRMQRRSKGNV